MCLPLIWTCVDRIDALNSRQKPSTVLTWKLLPDAIGRLVGHAELALKLFAAHTVARRAVQIHGIEPRNERGARVLKDGASGRVNVVTAGGANESAAGCQLVVSGFLAASRADEPRAAEPHRHDVVDARRVVGEALKELAN